VAAYLLAVLASTTACKQACVFSMPAATPRPDLPSLKRNGVTYHSRMAKTESRVFSS